VTRPAVLVIGPYPSGDIEKLEADYDILRYWEAADKAALLREHGNAIRAIATRGDLGASSELIAALPKLEMIGVYGVGVDGVDLAATRARGIKVSNTPDILTGETADIALALMLAVAREVPAGDRYVRSGEWAEKGNMPLSTRMHGKRLGIAGLGRIGKAIARRAAGFDMTISYFGRSAQEGVPYKFVPSLTELAAQSDFLVASVAGGAGTVKLITADVLKALGPKGFFVNVSRGTVVDETALLEALETKTIAGAGLDVFLNEPKIDPRFYALANTALMPHVGSATRETRAAMGQLMRDNIAAHFAGKPLLTPVA
jgi:lactate dehydrogenase-like 2-hydroxyacid dehydrogenase